MHVQTNPPHWNYYLILERDLERTFRFVEPVDSQLDVYSDEFARIILIASTEIENAFNGLAKTIVPASSPSNIGEYCSTVTGRFPNFASMEMLMPRFSREFSPWSGWTTTSAPDWWSMGYNKIKHNRVEHPNAPTMRRAIDAVGALQVVLLHYYRAKFEHAALSGDRESVLIVPNERDSEWQGASTAFTWDLPDDPRA